MYVYMYALVIFLMSFFTLQAEATLVKVTEKINKKSVLCLCVCVRAVGEDSVTVLCSPLRQSAVSAEMSV